MRVRANFIGPYRKCKYFYLEKKHLKNKRAFIKHIQKVAADWPSGTYYLKLSDGRVFARFDLINGKVKQLYRESPSTGKEYPVWDWFK